MINNASKRILRKYLTSCRLADAHLLHNGYVTNNQKTVYDNFKSLHDEMRSKKTKEFEELTNLRRKIFELNIKLAKKREELGRGSLTVTAKKRTENN